MVRCFTPVRSLFFSHFLVRRETILEIPRVSVPGVGRGSGVLASPSCGHHHDKGEVLVSHSVSVTRSENHRETSRLSRIVRTRSGKQSSGKSVRPNNHNNTICRLHIEECQHILSDHRLVEIRAVRVRRDDGVPDEKCLH